MKQHQYPVDRMAQIKFCAILGDFVLLNLCLVCTYLIMKLLCPGSIADTPLSLYIATANLSYIPAISIFGIVLHKRIVNSEVIVGRIIGTFLLFASVFLAMLTIMKDVPVTRKYLLWSLLIFLCLVIVWRLTLRLIVKRLRLKGKNKRYVVTVGGGDTMKNLVKTITEGAFGYSIVKSFSYEDATEVLPWLKERIESNTQPRVQDIFCSLSTGENRQVVRELIHFCDNNLVRFMIVPYIYNFMKRRLEIQMFNNVPVMSMHTEPLRRPFNRFIKRSFDILVSGLFLCTVFPIVYIIVGLAIKITSPGPIFFKQKRNGIDGKEFYCYKFRSMKVNKDSDTVQATKDDPRKTKLGNFLRKSNIDELPQFINVFKGDMSLVGPRPHMLKHTEEYSELIDKYMLRHLVKPGITGWAQVTGFRGETKELEQMEGRVRQDIWYMENWSFLLDLRIMIKTVTNMLGGEKNAY